MASIPYSHYPFTPPNRERRFGYIEALLLIPAIIRIISILINPGFDFSLIFLPLYCFAVWRNLFRLKQILILSQIAVAIYNLASIFHYLTIDIISYTIGFICVNALAFLVVSQQHEYRGLL